MAARSTWARRAAPSRSPSRRCAAAPSDIGFARPYTTDFLGWLDDFSTTGGGFDALGATARGFITFSNTLHPDSVATKQFRRCPGASEAPAPDGSNVLSQEEQDRLGCTEAHRAVPK